MFTLEDGFSWVTVASWCIVDREDGPNIFVCTISFDASSRNTIEHLCVAIDWNMLDNDDDSKEQFVFFFSLEDCSCWVVASWGTGKYWIRDFLFFPTL